MKPCGCVCGMCVCCECCKKKRKRVSEPIIIEDEEIMPETTIHPSRDLDPPLPPKKKKKKKKLGTEGNRIVISDDEDDDISATIHPTGDFEPPAPFLEPEPEPVHVTSNLEPPAAAPERKRKKAKHVTFNLEPPAAVATVATADLEPPPPPPPPRARKRITATLVTHDLEPPAPVTEGGGDDENPFLAAAAAAATKNGYKRRTIDVTDEKTGETYKVYDPFWDKMLESSDGKELDRQLHYMQLGGEFVDKKLGERSWDNEEVCRIYDDWLEKAFESNWSDEEARKKLKKMLKRFFS